jgi:hypothetical protein
MIRVPFRKEAWNGQEDCSWGSGFGEDADIIAEELSAMWEPDVGRLRQLAYHHDLVGPDGAAVEGSALNSAAGISSRIVRRPRDATPCRSTSLD